MLQVVRYWQKKQNNIIFVERIKALGMAVGWVLSYLGMVGRFHCNDPPFWDFRSDWDFLSHALPRYRKFGEVPISRVGGGVWHCFQQTLISFTSDLYNQN